MKELLEFLAKSLVDNPDKVVINETMGDNGEYVYQISVAEEDMGKIIGREGRIAKAIRTVAKSAAQKNGKKIVVDIIG